MPNSDRENTNYTFVQKVWIASGIIALVFVFLLLFEATFNVFILIFASILIASYFRGISSFIGEKTGWKSAITLTISIGGTILIFAGIFWMVGATVSNETDQIEEAIPEMIKEVRSFLDQSDAGRKGIEQVAEWQDSGKLGDFISTLFGSTFGYLGDFIIILVIGIFFTAAPNLYLDGIVQLVPPGNRGKAESVIDKLAAGLKNWLAGRFLAMLAVFILTGIGLAILGVPMWLTLALIAGLLNFIPNFGEYTGCTYWIFYKSHNSYSGCRFISGSAAAGKRFNKSHGSKKLGKNPSGYNYYFPVIGGFHDWNLGGYPCNSFSFNANNPGATNLHKSVK